jgi:hypothetical protein
MGIAFRQATHAQGTDSASLSIAPLPGSLILLQLQTTDSSTPTPTGFTDMYGATIETTAAPSARHGFRLWYRPAQSGDTATYAVPGTTHHYAIAEYTGSGGSSTLWTLVASAFATQQGAGASDHPHKTLSPVYSGQLLIGGAFIHNNTDTFTPDAGYTLAAVRNYGPTIGLVHRIETNTGSYDPGVSTAPFLGGYGAGAFAFSEAIVPEAGVW